MKVWTDELLPDITTFSTATPENIPTIPIDNYNAIVHLAWIPSFVDMIQPYRESPDLAPNPIQRVVSPSVTDVSVQVDEDADHPGDGWMTYDYANPNHYQLIFVNEQGQAEVARYIKYASVRDGMAVQGCRKKGDPVYGMALHARAYPHPNLTGPGIKDNDLQIFHPSSVNRHLVDDALIRLTDAGVVADVHTYRAQLTTKQNIKRQRLELDAKEREADGKQLLCERYLTHARARSRLQNHLLRDRPPSPPSNFVPRIHTAQGPPESEWVSEDGRDSLECRAVPKRRIRNLPTHKRKRSRSPTPFPYCLKCNEESPNHYEDDCPLWKVCHWCLTTDHAHNDCATPHHQCTFTRCIMPSWHPCAGEYCPTSFQDYSYAMRCAEFDADIEDNMTE